MEIQFTDTQNTYLKEIEEKLTNNSLAVQFVHSTSGIQNSWKLLQASYFTKPFTFILYIFPIGMMCSLM